jgi:hypothetical protein
MRPTPSSQANTRVRHVTVTSNFGRVDSEDVSSLLQHARRLPYDCSFAAARLAEEEEEEEQKGEWVGGGQVE